MNVELNKVWLKCRKCEYTWYPNPNMWKDKAEDSEKVLQCPKCFANNKLSKSLVVAIKEGYDQFLEPEWGTGEK